MSGKQRILVVDDDADIRDALVDLLIEEGFDVQTARDGIEALTLLRRTPCPHLILLDWMMPNLDGPGFRKQQRADPKLAGIPVVMLSAHARLDCAELELPADACLRKPVAMDLLLQVVRKYCKEPAPCTAQP